MTYQEKLKDPKWQKKRLEILERDDWTCQQCCDSESTLHVHHRYYVKCDPWEYANEALITLCDVCHFNEEKIRPSREKELLRALKGKFLAGEVESLASGFYDMKLLHAPEVIASVYEWALRDVDIQRELIEKYFNYIRKASKCQKTEQ